LALFYFAAGLALFAANIMLIWTFFSIQQAFAQLQQVQNARWQGFAFGMVFGFIVGAIAYKAGYCFAEFIKWLRGDLDDQLLVEYHDGLVALMSSQQGIAEGATELIAPGTAERKSLQPP
jgi:hypothetical protein